MTYTVCALTGAWFDDGCIEMSSTCGHRHKTLAAAQKCLAKLTETACDHGIKAGGRCSLCTGGRALPQNMAAKKYGADELRIAGEALFGDRWQTDMSRELGLTDARRIRQWLSGDRPIPVGVWADVCGLLRQRQMTIDRVLDELDGN